MRLFRGLTVSLSQWASYRFQFRGPTDESGTYGICTDFASWVFGPLYERLGFSKSGNAPVGSHVPGLLFSGGPLAVIWAVMLVVVFPVYGQSWFVPAGQAPLFKCSEIVPRLAHAYAPSAVIRIVSPVGLVAPTHHAGVDVEEYAVLFVAFGSSEEEGRALPIAELVRMPRRALSDGLSTPITWKSGNPEGRHTQSLYCVARIGEWSLSTSPANRFLILSERKKVN